MCSRFGHRWVDTKVTALSNEILEFICCQAKTQVQHAQVYSSLWLSFWLALALSGSLWLSLDLSLT